MHGIARYTYQLIKDFPSSEDSELLIVYQRKNFEPFDKAGVVWVDLNLPLFSPREWHEMPQILKTLKPDLLHVPAYWKPYPAPCPWVMTIHDLIHLCPPVSLKYRLYYAFLRRSLKRSAGLLTVSAASAETIGQWLQAPLPVRVTHLGVTDQYTIADQKELKVFEQKYFLYVGNSKHHKQFDCVAQAYQMSGLCSDYALFTLGVPQTQIPGHKALGFCPESDLPELYRGAMALLVPSLQEGFGLPAIEAMACGTPVLASDIPVHREVLGAAAHFVASNQIPAWSAEMLKMVREPLWRETLVQSGLDQSRIYRWPKMAAQTDRFYREILKR